MVRDLGRREAAKAATRQALQDAAARLFTLHGFSGTTVQQIADEAGVTERTFFRYFGSKDELLADLILGGLPVLQAAIVARPPDDGPLVAVRDALVASVLAAGEHDDQPVVARLFETGPPGLRMHKTGAHLLLRLESAVAEALQRRLGSDDEVSADLVFRTEVLASAAVAATRRALISNGALLARGEGSRKQLVALIREAFDVLTG